MGLLTNSALAEGWVTGKYRTGQEVRGPGFALRSQSSLAFDVTHPANAAKVEAVDALGARRADEAGITLVQMGIAFVLVHPAVTTTIIGPRTMAHLDGYLTADGVELSTDVFDRIDEIVRPGETVDVADNFSESGTRSLNAAYRRREQPAGLRRTTRRPRSRRCLRARRQRTPRDPTSQ